LVEQLLDAPVVGQGADPPPAGVGSGRGRFLVARVQVPERGGRQLPAAVQGPADRPHRNLVPPNRTQGEKLVRRRTEINKWKQKGGTAMSTLKADKRWPAVPTPSVPRV
jgi:hypothetical protein